MEKFSRSALVIVFISMLGISCKKQPDIDKSNPFFAEYNTLFDVPPFEKIMAKHYMPAFEKGMKEGRQELNEIIENKEAPTFENRLYYLIL